jgi:hypothetical protein
MPRRPLFVLPLLAAVAACDGEDPAAPCPLALSSGASPTSLVAQPSVRITVVDSVSGNSLAGPARGAFVRGSMADSLRHEGGTLVAYGPAGRYTVVVQVGAYQLWTRSDVQVGMGECVLETAELTARMQRAPGRD